MGKIFVIGFNKTATTTFHKLFLANKLKSEHKTVWHPEKFDCFSDGELILKDIIPPIIKSEIVNIQLSDFKDENDLCSHAHDILTQHIDKVKNEIVVHTIVLRFIHTLVND